MNYYYQLLGRHVWAALKVYAYAYIQAYMHTYAYTHKHIHASTHTDKFMHTHNHRDIPPPPLPTEEIPRPIPGSVKAAVCVTFRGC